MGTMSFFALFLCAAFCATQADRPKFSVLVSDEFLYIGKSAKVVITTTLTEPTPLKYKFKVPFNVSAYMRILEYKMSVNDSQISITGSKTPNMTSSAKNENIIDIVSLDLGTVTPIGTVDIVISFYAQLLDHPLACNGEDLWINIGAEFTNSTIWAHQHAVKRFAAIDMAPVLNASLKIPKMEKDDTLIDGTTVDIHIRVTHDPLKTTAEVIDADIALLHPDYLVHSAMVKTDADSVTATVKSSSTTARVLGTTALKYTDFVDYKLTFNIDPNKSRAKGKIHKAHIALQVSFKYSSPFYGTPRVGTLRTPAYNTIKFYSKRASCETAFVIANGQFRASSQGAMIASDAKLNGPKAWVPAINYKNDESQFIEINLQAIKEITRIHIQGNAVSGSWVNVFRVFYSLDDGVIWEMYKTKNGKKNLKGNTGPNKVAVVSLDPTIHAKRIRINPRAWTKEIGLRLELFGCASSLSAPAGTLNSMTYLVDVTTDYIYFCHIQMIRWNGGHSCRYSKDKGEHWIEIDTNVLNINFINPTTKEIFGKGRNNGHYKCSATPTGKCALISEAIYNAAKTGAVQAKVFDKTTITDDPNSLKPHSDDTFTMKNSAQKFGVSPSNIYYWDGSSWITRGRVKPELDPYC